MDRTVETENAEMMQAADDWPLRPWALAGIGAVAGLAIYELLDDSEWIAWRSALAAFAFFAALAAGFTLRPRRALEPVLFSLGLGAVMAGIAWLAVDSGDRFASEGFAFAAGVFFSILAVPLFQSDFHRRRWATPYEETHFHVWTDAISAGGAFAFFVLSYALMWLLHLLFSLVGIDIIEDLIQRGVFVAMFAGATFGGALGVLRNQLGIIGTLQRVVMLVFSLLAVPFAAAILVFLLVLLLSGGDALWDATDSATPVLLACAVGCFVLANAVIRDDDASRSDNVVMKLAALVLSAGILPLALFAAISMGIRIDQYGLVPDRIWALVAIAIATAYGIAYWAGLIRGRLSGWSGNLRRANLHLAVVSCAVALLLAFPLLDFGAISTRDQLARLESGEVPVDEFDFTALRWDFGESGREAIARLSRRSGEIGQLALAAKEQETRPWYTGTDMEGREDRAFDLRVESDDPRVKPFLLRRLRSEPWSCEDYCLAIDLGVNGEGVREIALLQEYGMEVFSMRADDAGMRETVEAPARGPSRGPLNKDSVVEVRTVTERYIFVDGVKMRQPLGDVGDGTSEVRVEPVE